MKVQDAELGMWVRIKRGIRQGQIGQIDNAPAPIVMLKMLDPDPSYDPPFLVAVEIRRLEPLNAIELLGKIAPR